MNFKSKNKLLLTLLPAAVLLVQLNGCDRRNVTADQPGAANSTSNGSSSSAGSPMTGSKGSPSSSSGAGAGK